MHLTLIQSCFVGRLGITHGLGLAIYFGWLMGDTETKEQRVLANDFLPFYYFGIYVIIVASINALCSKALFG